MEIESKFSILIVDDVQANLDFLANKLQPTYRVHIARSGKEALEVARENLPDLILLDADMPDMDGFTLLSAFKTSNATCMIPVILVAEKADSADEEKAFSLGAVDYVAKPLNPAVVKARMETHLQMLRLMRTIERLGMADELTESSNRRSFNAQINAEWGRAVREMLPIGVILVDIDNYTRYNESYGHAQGDFLLRNLAKLFEAALKRPADLVARLGGGEFGIMLPNTDLEGAALIAEEMREMVEFAKVPFIDGDKPTKVTVSVGVASTVPSLESAIADFLAVASKRLALAKAQGANRVCSRG